MKEIHWENLIKIIEGGVTNEKPVGTTWIAIATPDEVFSKQFLFGDNRDRNIRRAALQALNMLRKNLVGQ